MMEQSVPISQSREGWSPLALLRGLMANRGAMLLLALLLVVAIGTRFWDLGSRALHHDESLHAVFSHNLYDDGVYTHDPLMHGPVLFHLTALGFLLFGDSDYTSRLVPAILGVFLVWAPWKFRDWLGTKGALVASALVLISPSMMYYSRFIREDVFFAAWTVIIVYGMWRYLERGEDFHLYLMIAGWALAFSQKEVSFLLAFVVWVFLALLLLYHYRVAGGRMPLKEMREWHLLVVLGGLLLPHASALVLHLLNMDPAGGYNEATYRDVRFIQQAGLVTTLLFGVGAAAATWLWNGRKFAIAAAVFYAIFVLLHTTMLTWPFGIGSGMVGSLGYWIEQHDVERGGQPWWYYLMLLVLYEFLPLLIGVGGALLYGWRRAWEQVPLQEESYHLDARALWPVWNLWWFAVILFILSYAGEKMPWLLMHIALPLTFLGGWLLGRVLDGLTAERVRSQAGIAFGLLFTLLLLALTTILWLLLRGEGPLQGNSQEQLASSGRWLVALVILVGSGWAALRYRDEIGARGVRQIGLLVFSFLLGLATLRFAVIASFINADVPNEPLIYTQSSPDVVRVMREIEIISERIAGGTNLNLAYDSSTSWPYSWYLRDYPNAFYLGGNPEGYTDAIRNASVILAGPENDNASKIARIVPDYIPHHYSMRPNFPEDYKNGEQIRENQPDPNDPSRTVRVAVGGTSRSPLNILGNLWHLALDRQTRVDFLDFYVHRTLKMPLGDYPMWVYVKPEVAAEVWQYGLTVAAMDPDLVRDPFADVMVERIPTVNLQGPGGFSAPKNVVMLRDGTLAVADSGNHRIQLMRPDGTLVRTIGSGPSSEQGQFNEPWGIAAAPDGTFYVADTWNHRVQHLNAEGEVLHVWGSFAEGGESAPDGTFWGPRGIAVDREGNVYVTDTGNKRVQKFDPTGQFLGKFGTSGAGPGQLSEPVGVAIAPDGTIYVADTWNQRVQSFDADFVPLKQMPVRAWSGQSIFNKPFIAASNERIWVSDPEGNRIIELNTNGEPTAVWGSFSEAFNGLNRPVGLSFDGERLWVADSENHRVLGFDVSEQ